MEISAKNWGQIVEPNEIGNDLKLLSKRYDVLLNFYFEFPMKCEILSEKGIIQTYHQIPYSISIRTRMLLVK